MKRTNSRLKAIRALRQLTQSQLAAKLGRSQSWVCGIERGKVQPSEIDIALLCRALRVRPESVFQPPSVEAEPFKELIDG